MYNDCSAPTSRWDTLERRVLLLLLLTLSAEAVVTRANANSKVPVEITKKGFIIIYLGDDRIMN
jgi:hypothetical protein